MTTQPEPEPEPERAPALAPAPTPPFPRRFPLPTSFGGVAAVAERSGGWLAAWQGLFASITAIAAIWAFEVAWGRALQRAISNLPEQGGIRNGSLEWPEDNARVLHQGPFLSIVVDPTGLREFGLATDVTLSLESDRLAIRSVLGWTAVRYPNDLEVPLRRNDAAGAVAAWRVPSYFGFGLAIAVGLVLVWTLLSIGYGMVVWIGAVAMSRPTPFRVARRLAGASLLPGCVLMIAAILLYATRQISLVGFLLTLPLHVVVGWIYCAGGWTRLSRPTNRELSTAQNPFGRAIPEMETRADENPFRTGA